MMLNQVARYGPVAALVEDCPGTTVLEAGSGSEGIAELLSPRWQITATDVDFSDYGAVAEGGEGRAARVQADVLQLPFQDRSFDVAVAVDLLEHVPGDARPRALGELARVADKRVVVAVPSGGAALAADRRLARHYESKGVQIPVWLSEHLDNGFPEPAELERALAPHGRVRLLPNESVWTHERVAKLEIHPRLGRFSPLLAERLAPAVTLRRSRLAGGLLDVLRGFDREPAYRTIAVLDRAPE